MKSWLREGDAISWDVLWHWECVHACDVIICRAQWLTIDPCFHKHLITSLRLEIGCCNKEKLVYSTSHSSTMILVSYWGPVDEKMNELVILYSFFLEDLHIVLFPLTIIHVSLFGFIVLSLWLMWQHPGHGVEPLPAGGHFARPAVSAGSLSLFRPTGSRGGPQIHILCGLKGSVCRPSGLNGSVFHGGGWNMPGQDKHSHCGLFKMASCQPPHCRCIEWTPPNISLETFIASRSGLKSGGSGTLCQPGLWISIVRIR